MLRTVSRTWPTSAEDPPTMLCLQGMVFAATSSFLPKHFLLRAKPFAAVTPLRSELCPFVLSAFSGRPFAAEIHQAPLQLTLNAMLLFFLMQCAIKLLHLFEVHTMLLLFHHQAWFAGVYRLCCVLTGQESNGSFFSLYLIKRGYLGFKDEDLCMEL